MSPGTKKRKKKRKKRNTIFVLILKKMKYLVTGCAGFIGSHFVKRVLEESEENSVIGVDCMYPCSSPKTVEPRERFLFVRDNINTPNLIRNLLIEHDIDIMVHFAAQSHVDTSFSDMRQHVMDNAVGTFNVLEGMREANTLKSKKTRLILISTDEVYGENKGDEPHGETSVLKPTSIYSASKASAEMFCYAYTTSFQQDIVIVRGNNCYGKQYPEKLIPRFISLLLAGKHLTVQGSGLQRRSFLYVDDFCDAIFCVIKKGVNGHIYNIGSKDELTVLEVAQILAEEMKCELKLRFVKDRNFNDTRYLVHTTELENLGWRQKTRFRDGVREVIAFFQSPECVDYWVKTYDLPNLPSVEPPLFFRKEEPVEPDAKRIKNE